MRRHTDRTLIMPVLSRRLQMLRVGKPNSQSAAASSANGARPTLRGGRACDCGRGVVGEPATLHGRLTVANQHVRQRPRWR